MKYISSTNSLYQKLVKQSVDNLKSNSKECDISSHLTLPIRTLQSGQIMPLHEVFNTGNEALSRTFIKVMGSMSSISDIIEECNRRWPPLLYGDKDKVKYNNLKLYLLQHVFFLKEAAIATNCGEEVNVKNVYIPNHNKNLYKFDEKTREIEGYYLFIGNKVDILIVGKPIKNNEIVIEPFEFQNLKNFPLKDEIIRIQSWVKKKQITTKGLKLTMIDNDSDVFTNPLEE
jgi:hypothetical protein